MTCKNCEELQNRITDLEQEVADREQDLLTYRGELTRVNQRIEVLINGLNSELNIAHKIQKRLVPTELPHIPGFEISTKFVPSPIKGGDYYDLFEHEDPNRFSTVVASSTGYAMSALLLSVLLKLTGQLEARKGASPEKILSEIANELLPSSQIGDQTDIFYGVVDRRSFELSFCSAGSIVALYQDYSTEIITPLKPTAKSLQVGGDSQSFTVNQQKLNPRDRVVIVSPGLISARNSVGESFGIERVVKCMKDAPKRGVHELRNEILFQVKAFCGESENQRDYTAVILEVKDRVITLAKRH